MNFRFYFHDIYLTLLLQDNYLKDVNYHVLVVYPNKIWAVQFRKPVFSFFLPPQKDEKKQRPIFYSSAKAQEIV